MSGLGQAGPDDVTRALSLAAAGTFRGVVHRIVEEANPIGKVILDPALG